MKKYGLTILATLFFGIGFNACATTGSGTGTKLDVPDWVMSTPKEEGDSYVFVGSSSDDNGDLTKAEMAAQNNAITAIVQEIGVKISVNTDAEVKASMDSFQAQVTASVKNSSDARIKGLRLAERFPLTKGKRVEVYLKFLYKKEDLDGEKARLLEIERKKNAAVIGVEKEGDALASAGKYLQAVEKYIQAAAAASVSDIDIADIHFNNNINKAREILSRLTLVTLTPSQSTSVGTTFAKPFQVKLVYGTPESGSPVVDASLLLDYKMKGAVRLTTLSQVVKTEKTGIASFDYPAPDFAGKDNVNVRLNVAPYLDILAKVPSKFKAQVNSLEDVAVKGRVSMAFVVASNAKNIPLAISVYELDPDGNPTGKSQTAASVMEGLQKAGFKINPIPQGMAASIKDADAPEALAKLKGSMGGAKRLVYATVSIADVDESGPILAQAKGSLTVVDAATGNVLLTTTKSKRGTGNTKAIAINSAFKEIGALFAKEMADNLP